MLWQNAKRRRVPLRIGSGKASKLRLVAAGAGPALKRRKMKAAGGKASARLTSPRDADAADVLLGLADTSPETSEQHQPTALGVEEAWMAPESSPMGSPSKSKSISALKQWQEHEQQRWQQQHFDYHPRVSKSIDMLHLAETATIKVEAHMEIGGGVAED